MFPWLCTPIQSGFAARADQPATFRGRLRSPPVTLYAKPACLLCLTACASSCQREAGSLDGPVADRQGTVSSVSPASPGNGTSVDRAAAAPADAVAAAAPAGVFACSSEGLRFEAYVAREDGSWFHFYQLSQRAPEASWRALAPERQRRLAAAFAEPSFLDSPRELGAGGSSALDAAVRTLYGGSVARTHIARAVAGASSAHDALFERCTSGWSQGSADAPLAAAAALDKLERQRPSSDAARQLLAQIVSELRRRPGFVTP